MSISIKPLEWEQPTGPWTVVASGLGINYRVSQSIGDGATWGMWIQNARRGTYGTIGEAKAAAQADYEARILAALDSPPDHGGGEEERFPKTLGLIHKAINRYVDALVAREHGGVAENRAFAAICEALGRSPTAEMDARRRASLPTQESEDGR